MVKPCDPTALTTYYLALFVPSGTQGLNYSFPSSTVLCFVLGLAPGNSICAKFSAKSSSPIHGWTASPVLPFEVPVECLSCDVHCVRCRVYSTHHQFRSLMVSGIGLCCVLLQSSLLEIVSGLILFGGFVVGRCSQQNWSFKSSALMCFHVSEPYNKTDFTLELKMFSLFLLFQTGFRVTKTCRAFPILDLMSSSCLLSC